MDWLDEKGYLVMTWSPYSPDLNPIKQVWYMMKTWIAKNHLEIWACTLGEERIKAVIIDAVEKAWEVVGEDYLESLMKSMPQRVADVIQVDAGYTKY